jgi:cysteine-rich repeat protein
MLVRRIVTALALVTTASPAWAFAPSHAGHPEGLQLASGAHVRVARQTAVSAPAGHPPWAALVGDDATSWRATWDVHTGVPLRILGRGLAVPGSIARPEVAAAAAKAFLAEHLALLAPGASIGDFVLVSNTLDGGMRSVGFEQHHQGLRVRGGQVSFRFKKDRLFVVGSEAVPHVRVPPYAAAVLDASRARELAAAWVAEEGSTALTVGAVSAPFVLPVVLESGEGFQRRVIEVTVESAEPRGRWAVALDAETGLRVAREQTLRFITGTVTMNTPERRPGAVRRDTPARGLRITVDGRAVETSATGSFTTTASRAATVATSVVGRLVRVVNNSGNGATITGTVEDGGTLAWNGASTEQLDSQLTTYISSLVVKDYMRIVAPNLNYLDTQLEANVNLDDVCNAFSDGETINFFNSGQGCENTGRLPDVIYHEYGHAVHANSIIRGVGGFDTALSEGASDYLAAVITGDQGMGRGFFFNNQALRQVDPNNDEAVWPADIDQDPHVTGLIFAGAMWDLRKTLITKYGDAPGRALADRLWYAVLQRAADIPSSYAEVVAADDDDGDVTNGTPNLCDITAAFQAHGLASGEGVGPQIGAANRTDFDVSVTITGDALCPGGELNGAELVWEVRGSGGIGGRIPLNNNGGTLFSASIPQQPAGTVVRYRIEGQLASGEVKSLPDNAADPMYEFYVGPTVPLYCSDFEDDPFLEGWTHALLSGRNREGADDWAWGTPAGVEGSGDPTSALSGRGAIGNDIGGENFNGAYQPGISNEVVSPMIDTQGYTTVRLQYWRWLNVEDGAFDKAEILADGAILWSNLAEGTQADPGTNHTDKEWRFHDVDVSSQAGDGSVQIRYRMTTDRGVELGGWTIDDFCLVGVDTSVVPVCGNGQLEAGEVCDDGNLDNGDGCEASCTATPAPICGDGVVGMGEACDDGNDVDTDGCTRQCTPTTSVPAACGNGQLEAGEACDDGNAAANDGCSSSCTVEAPAVVQPDVIGTEDPSCGCATSTPSSGLPSALFLLVGLYLVRRRAR